MYAPRIAVVGARVFTAVAIGLLACHTLAAPADNRLGAPGHLRLIAPLDRPQDGYCLDIVGSGAHVRFDLPMTAHNCKPGLYADEAVVLESSGRILFPAYNKCATAAGLNSRALPGAAIVPRDCGERSPFLEAERLQVFRLKTNGQLELEGSGLCMTAGGRSDRTFSAEHRWRALFLEECHLADPKLSRWKFSVPPQAN